MAYKIPLFNLNFDEREAQAAYDTIKSGWISTGPKNAELEQMFIDMWKRMKSTRKQPEMLITNFLPNEELVKKQPIMF